MRSVHLLPVDGGSSPRTWGTPDRVHDQQRRHRFIPTYMGNAGSGSLSRKKKPVHPHVHGERMETRLRVGSTLRFIPTYMGNANRLPRIPQAPPVHPHVHGERPLETITSRAVDGSSPRTWGTHEWTSSQNVPNRFIPTYMGNANDGQTTVHPASVHPHVHGERPAGTVSDGVEAGSSPRTWGTLPVHQEPDPPVRFIPTYMGNAFFFNI